MRAPSRFWFCLGLAALTVAAYLPVWQNGFVDCDDETCIVENATVTNGLTWATFCAAWSLDPGPSPYWMPLTWLSLQCDAQFFSGQTPEGKRILCPAAFHAQNLFWHAAGVVLLFLICRRVSGRPWPSFLIAALFAVHPMHVESVAWAIERKDVLCNFFGLLTLAAYLRYAEKPSWQRYAAVAAAWLLSLMCKPMLITMPCVLLLLDYWPLGRMRLNGCAAEAANATPSGRVRFERLLLEKLPLFVLALIFAVLTLETRDQRGFMVSLDTISLSARLANALTAYGWYCLATIYPVRLGHLYPHAYENWSVLPAVLGAATLLACTLLAWQQRKRRPWLLVGWLWFVGTLLPVIGFAQGGRQAWADRFCYWPHVGLFLALVWEAAGWMERLKVSAVVGRLAGAGVLGWLACLTWGQVGTWRDSLTLWEHSARVTGENDQAHEHLARHYYLQGQEEQVQFHLGEALRIQRQRLPMPRVRVVLEVPGGAGRDLLRPIPVESKPTEPSNDGPST